MSAIISNNRNNYIILTNNIIDISNGGSLLYIKTNISDLSNNNTDISWQKLLQSLDNSNNTYKNRILLSGKVINISGSTTTSTSCCLISQNNIKNNMKFIFDSSNNKNGKILFVKNLNTYDNSYNYLFNDLSNIFFGKNNIDPYNIYNSLTTNNDTSYNRYRFHLNYYFSNSDMYQINIRDYLYSKYSDSQENYNTTYSITSVTNDFSFINTTIDTSSVINFKNSNFTRLLIDNVSRSNTPTIFTTDNSFTILEENTPYSINRNILSYNKLTLDFKHVNYYDFSSTYTSSSINNSNTISTFLIKTNNLNIIQNIKKNSKIICGSKKSIIFQNVKVLDYNSNLYDRTISFNNQSKILKQDFSNTIFLGLGNRLTGITQHDIYNHAHFSTNSKQKSIVTFKKNINTNNIDNNFNFQSLIPSKNNYYLLDICLNYTSINYSHNINNTINYNVILYNNVIAQLGKVFNINLATYFNALTNNNFKNSFKNLAKINNITTICGEIYSISYEQINAAINVKFKNFIRDSNINDFTITNDENIKLFNIKQLQDDDNKNNILLTSPINYDLRYNYNRIFNIFNDLDIYLKNVSGSLGLKNTYFDFEILNFYSIRFANFVITTGASDFTNVDCVYIYHDPINDPDERFRYPNNNIEIKFDSTIDTLSKAIEQYRGTGARTSTTNAAFIPAQNGSNLSRKMIQGFVGLNNIPKLLSIEPYDPSFINGRGFINQYQLDDTCITSNCDKVAVKQNAIKHDSVKNNRIYSSNSLKKQNFANIVKSNSRNKLSQACINNNITLNNVVTINNTINDPNCTNIKKTPFTVMFSKGKGKLLSG
jgi:hypothetical protein